MAEGFQTAGRDPSEYRKGSAEAERMHPLDVPAHGDEAPLAADAIEPAQQELAESHHRFDDAEHRLRGLLAQTVELLALRCPQTPGHGFDRCRVFPAPESARQTARARRDDAAAARSQSAARC